MPNIGAVLRDEVTRLARKEIRQQVGATRKATIQHRRDIAELKRQVRLLERLVAVLSRRAATARAAASAPATTGGLRFGAKALVAQRKRLSLSAVDFGKLVGVSGQSIYNWEHGTAKPRAAQLAAVAAIRPLGKREAQARLAALSAKGRAKPRSS
ncbi:MAG: helix-turn-helix domain-containing protein [Betaproteobacteria bacterium]